MRFIFLGMSTRVRVSKDKACTSILPPHGVTFIARSAAIVSLLLVVHAAAICQTEPKKTNSRPTAPSETPSRASAAKPEPYDKADIRTMAGQCVRFETERGDIELELYPEQAPETVRNFLNLVATGLYDTTTFSRVVPGFVIQGGDLATRQGELSVAIGMRSRRTIPDEPNKIIHDRGVLSMARSEQPHSASTHFFILVSVAPDLDGKFAAFGRVTKGMEVVDEINKGPVVNEKPDKPVRLKKASVFPCSPTAN
jgi:peptidyl-prolyl cis-trans isomerase B (cyclophilin B)